MVAVAIVHRATIERTVERIRRVGKGLRVHSDRARRRRLAAKLSRKRELDHLLDQRGGYARIPTGTIAEMGPAIEFAYSALAEYRKTHRLGANQHLIVLGNYDQYEQAPQLFDLALSDSVLQIASRYLGEVPILTGLKLKWSPINTRLKGSQLYHRDGMYWLQRRAKFIFAMNDIDESCGPFTFLPADVSHHASRALGSLAAQRDVPDEVMYKHVSPRDALSLTGPAGTGMMVDSSQCFHYGARSRGGERLQLFFSFHPSLDAPETGSKFRRTAAFHQRFGDDPVRNLVIPDSN
jgi:hypothetical protein